MEYLAFALFALFVLAMVLVLPLALWVALYRTRTRLMLLEQAFGEQREAVGRLTAEVTQLKGAAGARPYPAEPATTPAAPAARPGPIAPAPPPIAVPPRPVPPAPMAAPPPLAAKPSAPPAQPPTPPAPTVAPPPAATAPSATAPRPPAAVPPAAAATPAAPAVVSPPTRTPGERPTLPPRVPPRVPPPPPPRPPAPSFDWESLVGVKLFAAFAGIALVIAAVSFLGYSMQQGWLQPPVRVMIGLAVAIALLVVCEMKAARKYPATANALDAAAIAILFSTFFAAHALWNLIPTVPTFALLAAVTALAVLLSIRRESLFIAVLGLLGGFATPALLSTGENRPIPLFAYLMLLNVGLAWVAYRQVWPVLTALTLILTTIYQWVWVSKFLTANDLSLAVGIFALFPVLSVSALLLGRRGRAAGQSGEGMFEGSAMVSAALPLAFAGYLAVVPEYGSHPVLLFGFLLMIDAGLLAISLALRRPALHAISAVMTVFIWAVWLTTSYRPGDWAIAVSFVSAFVALYLFAPGIAGWFKRPLTGSAGRAVHAAAALLFVFPVLARIEPAAASPWPIFGVLLVLVVLCGWRAAALDRGRVFFAASFFAVATEAVWSATHLTVDRLRPAVIVYALFGVTLTAIPFVARRMKHPLRPQAGGGFVLIASLALLLFLSVGPIAPAALWALALLLAILNAGMFVESASSRIPTLSRIGSVLSWLVLAVWWSETAGVVGLLPSLAVLTGLTLITLAGHAWVHSATEEAAAATLSGGLYLGLIGHAFLFFIGLNPQWSVPPWPLFGCLAVVTLATSATAAFVGGPALHILGVAAASLVISGWTVAAGWTTTAIAAAWVISIYALAWIAAGRDADEREPFMRAAAVALLGGELTAILAAGAPIVTGIVSPTPFVILLASHVAGIAILLTLVSAARWPQAAAGVLMAAWAAVLGWQFGHDLTAEWRQLVALAGSLYTVFCVYALVAGPRQRESREPWLVALGATVMAFFAGRQAFEAGGLQSIIGSVPVVLGLVTVVLLRRLLRLEQAGERDLTRLALVAGTALGLVTVAIPLQLHHQWITIGWALEGAALAWLFRRVPHRGLLLASAALLTTVFVRLALNPSIWSYEPRGEMRIVNWYLYTYLVAAAAMGAAAWWLSTTSDRVIQGLPRVSHLLPAAAGVLLFLLLNIEIADFYATGPQITFRFGVTVSQDLTYTIGWLAFGMILLAVGIYTHNRPARITAVALIAVTAFKCFLYDLASLGGLYRVASFVGLAVALALVSLALQKFVLARPEPSR
ncbi:MAG TPA: DUF2339 domain-containing protein [Vicinamibacterales bacterium]|nr:DUF2339 domain-containing protein [Vicinamibacterales bacterium]